MNVSWSGLESCGWQNTAKEQCETKGRWVVVELNNRILNCRGDVTKKKFSHLKHWGKASKLLKSFSSEEIKQEDFGINLCETKRRLLGSDSG